MENTYRQNINIKRSSENTSYKVEMDKNKLDRKDTNLSSEDIKSQTNSSENVEKIIKYFEKIGLDLTKIDVSKNDQAAENLDQINQLIEQLSEIITENVDDPQLKNKLSQLENEYSTMLNKLLASQDPEDMKEIVNEFKNYIADLMPETIEIEKLFNNIIKANEEENIVNKQQKNNVDNAELIDAQQESINEGQYTKSFNNEQINDKMYTIFSRAGANNQVTHEEQNYQMNLSTQISSNMYEGALNSGNILLLVMIVLMRAAAQTQQILGLQSQQILANQNKAQNLEKMLPLLTSLTFGTKYKKGKDGKGEEINDIYTLYKAYKDKDLRSQDIAAITTAMEELKQFAKENDDKDNSFFDTDGEIKVDQIDRLMDTYFTKIAVNGISITEVKINNHMSLDSTFLSASYKRVKDEATSISQRTPEENTVFNAIQSSYKTLIDSVATTLHSLESVFQNINR